MDDCLKKSFKNFEELMEFDFTQLKKKSNYLTINTLPKLKRNQNLDKWRVVAKPQGKFNPEVLIEITPMWITITIHRGVNLNSRRINIPIPRNEKDSCHKKDLDPKPILKGIFEF